MRAAGMARIDAAGRVRYFAQAQLQRLDDAAELSLMRKLALFPRLIEAAGDLYAKPLTGFRKVTLPLSLPGVVAGTLLTFIPAAGDYINAQLLGSPKDKMIGNVIESQFIRIRDYPTAAAMSFVLLLTILLLVTIYIRRGPCARRSVTASVE